SVQLDDLVWSLVQCNTCAKHLKEIDRATVRYEFFPPIGVDVFHLHDVGTVVSEKLKYTIDECLFENIEFTKVPSSKMPCRGSMVLRWDDEPLRNIADTEL